MPFGGARAPATAPALAPAEAPPGYPPMPTKAPSKLPFGAPAPAPAKAGYPPMPAQAPSKLPFGVPAPAPRLNDASERPRRAGAATRSPDAPAPRLASLVASTTGLLTTCAVCGAEAATKACARCKTLYCSQHCQTEHWKTGHKKRCKKIRRAGGAEQYQRPRRMLPSRTASSPRTIQVVAAASPRPGTLAGITRTPSLRKRRTPRSRRARRRACPRTWSASSASRRSTACLDPARASCGGARAARRRDWRICLVWRGRGTWR